MISMLNAKLIILPNFPQLHEYTCKTNIDLSYIYMILVVNW